MQFDRRRALWLSAGLLSGLNFAAQAETVAVVVDPGLPWVSYVNVYQLPAAPDQDRGTWVQGEFLDGDTSRMSVAFGGATLVMGPNGNYAGGPPGDPFWWQPDGNGGYVANKVLESNFYVDELFTGVNLSGKTVSFSGRALTQDMPAGYAAYAWIRDFDPTYSWLVDSRTELLVAGQSFSLELDTSAGGAVQYGFAVVGLNADPATLNPAQTVTIAAVPEPASVAMMLAGALAVVGVVRRRRAG